MKQKRRPWVNPLSLVLGVAFLLLAWYALAHGMRLSGSSVLLDPFDTLLAMGRLLFGDGAATTYASIGFSLLRLLIGFAVSFALGGALGTLAGLFPAVEHFMKPFVAVSRTIPTAAVVLVLTALFLVPGKLPFADYIPSFLTFLVAFPLLYEAFRKGIRETDRDLADALELDAGRKSLRGTVHVLWPNSRPYVELALAQGLGLSFKVTIMSEVLSASSATHSGLGTLIMECQTNPLLRVEDILPYSVIALLLMFVIDIPLWILKKKKD